MDFQILARIKISDFLTETFSPKIVTGIRPIIRYEGMIGGSCALVLENVEEVFPGDTLDVQIAFLNPKSHEQILKADMEFTLHAGAIEIATGIVLFAG
jgi:hypothetical protein